MHEHQCDAYCMLCLCFLSRLHPSSQCLSGQRLFYFYLSVYNPLRFLQEGAYDKLSVDDKLINGMMGIVLATIIHSNVNMHIEIIACSMTPSSLNTSVRSYA